MLRGGSRASRAPTAASNGAAAAVERSEAAIEAALDALIARRFPNDQDELKG